MRRAVRSLVVALVSLSACAPDRSCDAPCDSATVARRIAGTDAIDCGVATGAPDAVESCMATAFDGGSPFFGLVEMPSSMEGIVLIRGFVRGADGVLREVLGTRQPDRAIVQTRVCFAAHIEPGGTAPTLVCTDEMSGVFIECQCLNPTDGGPADAN